MSDISSDTKNSKPAGQEALTNMHGALLEALRHREQEIFSYLGILVPALGGFIWLVVHFCADCPKQTCADKTCVGEGSFLAGMVGVLLMLLLGAVYSLALGYNYRYITFQLAKIEHKLEMEAAILGGWPKFPEGFKKYIGWCEPPEMIKVFWHAFLVGTVLVMTAGALAFTKGSIQAVLTVIGSVLIVWILQTLLKRRLEAQEAKQRESSNYKRIWLLRSLKIAFTAAVVMALAAWIMKMNAKGFWTGLLTGFVCLLTGSLYPAYYGRKFREKLWQADRAKS